MGYQRQTPQQHLFDALQRDGVPTLEQQTGLGLFEVGINKMSYNSDTHSLSVCMQADVALQKEGNVDGADSNSDSFNRMLYVAGIEVNGDSRHLVVGDWIDQSTGNISKPVRLSLDHVIGYKPLTERND